MKVCVIDTSVAVKWYIPEPGYREASGYLSEQKKGSAKLIAPDFLAIELANVLWNKVGQGELKPGIAEEIATIVSTAIPLYLYPSAELLSPALTLALNTGLTVYDCLFVALALRQKAALVTLDRKMASIVRNLPLGIKVDEI